MSSSFYDDSKRKLRTSAFKDSAINAVPEHGRAVNAASSLHDNTSPKSKSDYSRESSVLDTESDNDVHGDFDHASNNDDAPKETKAPRSRCCRKCMRLFEVSRIQSVAMRRLTRKLPEME